MTAQKRVLVIAAHPDDELLGVGGTIALHAVNGDQVTCIVAAASNLKHSIDGAEDVRGQAQLAAAVLGVHELKLLDFPDQGLDRFSLVDVISPLERIVDEVRPHIVYLQYGYDINRDHQILFQAALVATRPMEKNIEGIFAFDTVSSTEWAYPRTFIPDTWVDISTMLERKLEAMACYETELRDWPHPRSLRSLRAKAESAGSQVVAEAAECFMTIRRILRDGKTPV
jgi:LmbE family N-acetylglucosaminyl deacetylase